MKVNKNLNLMEFSTKSDPHTPANEGGGIGARDPHQLYNKILQNDLNNFYSKKHKTSKDYIFASATTQLLFENGRKTR